MHIDWFVVVVAAITIPLAWWAFWLAVKNKHDKTESDEPKSAR